MMLQSFTHIAKNVLSVDQEHHAPQHLMKVFLLLTFVLCAWTHPRYYRSRLATLTRAPLTLATVTWWLCYPFTFPVKPQENNQAANVGQFTLCFLLMTKCLDWGLFSGPQQRRTWVRNSDGKSGRWESTEKDLNAQVGIGALLEHIFFQLTSLRGSQFPWGHFSEINTNTWSADLSRFVLCQFYSLAVLAGLLYVKKISPNSMTHWFINRGLPLPIISLVTPCVESFFLITCLMAATESANSSLAVLAHLLHPVLSVFGFPKVICEFTDPVYYPPLFGNPLELNSVSQFWGRIWQQVFRRSFIVFGAFPLAGIGRAMGASRERQKTIGFIGAFVASGFLHAGPLYVMPDVTGNISLQDKISVFLCFVVQGIGSLVEPTIIPLVPKSLGGGSLWAFFFLTGTLQLFSSPVCKPGRVLDMFQPLDEWNLRTLVTPVMISIFFS